MGIVDKVNGDSRVFGPGLGRMNFSFTEMRKTMRQELCLAHIKFEISRRHQGKDAEQ